MYSRSRMQSIQINANNELGEDDIKDKMREKSPIQLMHYSSRPLSCNGDCGSHFSKMINNIIYEQNTPLDLTEEQIIAHEFWLPDSPLRLLLIKQIENQPIININSDYRQMLYQLRDENFYIKGETWTRLIKAFFRMLYEENYAHILHTLSNQTCLFPDSRSMFGEYVAHHQRTKDRLQHELNAMNEKLLQYLDPQFRTNNSQQYLKDMWTRSELQQKLNNWKPKPPQDELSLLQTFESKLKAVKQHEKYKLMKRRNMALTHTEIYAVMLYCSENGLCSTLRKSQRERNKFNVSCEWKSFFYHLCCAVYKIREIFHYKNAQFEREWITNRPANSDKLYRGIQDIHRIQKTHRLHTISSFTYQPGVAKGFAGSNGMILAIADAFKAIYDGELMAADVSWISGYEGECEFLVAPTEFHNIERVSQDNINYDLFIDFNKVFVFQISDCKSDKLKAIEYNVSARVQNPLFSLEELLPSHNKQISQCIAGALVLGAFGYRCVCPICEVRYRLCEHATSLLNGNAECPACRALFAQYPHLNDGTLKPHELECYNMDCRKNMRHTDLLQVEDKKHLGYMCRFCGEQQRQALSDRYTNDTYLEHVSDEYIKHIEQATLELQNDGVNIQQLRLQKDKKQFIDVLRFVMNIERVNKGDLGGIWCKPIIWKWIAEMCRGYTGLSDPITNFFGMEKEVQSNSNDVFNKIEPIMHQTQTIVETVIGQQHVPDVLQKGFSWASAVFK
eukprot:150073_1